MIWVQPAPGHVVASLDKTLYDDYLYLVASNKQEIQWTRIRRLVLEHWITRNSEVDADSSKHEVLIANLMKSVRFIQ